MKVGALIKQSFSSIAHNKIRSGLTILGIVIGISSVIALVGLGKGLQANVTQRLGNLDTKRMTFQSLNPERETVQRERGGPNGGGAQGGFVFQRGGGGTETLTEADYATVKGTTNIAAASPDASTQTDVTKSADAGEATAFQLHGADTAYASMQKYELTAGEFLTETQVDESHNVLIIGDQAAQDLLGSDVNPLGQKLYLKGTEFTVTGVLKAPADAPPFNNPADNLYIGYKRWLTLSEKSVFSTILADASSDDTVDSASQTALKAMLTSHNITDETKADIGVSMNKDLLNTVSSVAGSFTDTLAGIAAISLIVGGIGIMNIMLVTVTERTREIGLRRAVGAKKHQILLQFLVESVLLTLIGGIVGVLLGMIFSNYAGAIVGNIPGRGIGGANASSVQAVIDLGTMVMAVGISAGIGIVFGLFPAIKAANLDPVEALRHE